MKESSKQLLAKHSINKTSTANTAEGDQKTAKEKDTSIKEDTPLKGVLENVNGIEKETTEKVFPNDVDGLDAINVDIKPADEISNESRQKPDESIGKEEVDSPGKKNKVDAKVTKAKNRKNKKAAAKAREREIIESVQQELRELESSPKEKKGGAGLLSMFKFSRKKPKVNPDGVSEGTSETGENVVQNGTIHEAIGTTKEINEDVLDAVNNVKESITTLGDAPDVNAKNGETDQAGTSDKSSVQIDMSRSYDSGVVVESTIEPQDNDVQYAVVQKRKQPILEDAHPSTSDPTEQSEKVEESKKKETQEVYINGDKTDEDFVYINERAIDIDGLNEVVEEKLRKAKEARDSSREGSEKGSLPRSRKSSTFEVGSPSRVEQIKKAENTKIKRKSWSFQIGGNRNKSKSAEGFTSESSGNEGPVSMDPGNSGNAAAEPKKGKWRLGKFSFRKSSGDISSSTPNLNEVGQSSEGDSSPAKPAMKSDPRKLKKIKAKKEKKKKENQTEKKSGSLMNLIFRDNQPRSRRSIVEDDINIQETDAFDGVQLSDLSHDEDDQVSHNPNGAQAAKSTNKKEKKKKENREKSSERKLDDKTKLESAGKAAAVGLVEDAVMKKDSLAEAVSTLRQDSNVLTKEPTEAVKENKDQEESGNGQTENTEVGDAKVDIEINNVTSTTEASPEIETEVAQNAFSNLIYGEISDVMDNENNKMKVDNSDLVVAETEKKAENSSDEKRPEEKRTSRIEIKLSSPKQSVIDDGELAGTYVTLNEVLEKDNASEKTSGETENDVATGSKTHLPEANVNNLPDRESIEVFVSEVIKKSEAALKKEQEETVEEDVMVEEGAVIEEDAVMEEGAVVEEDVMVEEGAVVEEEITKSMKKEYQVAISFPEPSTKTTTKCESADDDNNCDEESVLSGIAASVIKNTEQGDVIGEHTLEENVPKTDPVTKFESADDKNECDGKSVPCSDAPVVVHETENREPVSESTAGEKLSEIDSTTKEFSAEIIEKSETLSQVETEPSVADIVCKTFDVTIPKQFIEQSESFVEDDFQTDKNQDEKNGIVQCLSSTETESANIPGENVENTTLSETENVDTLPEVVHKPECVPKQIVIIMKEVGVQAPDIHIPLDVDKEFGFVKGEVVSVSVGTQATDTAVDRIPLTPTVTSDDSSSQSPAAFF